MKRVNKIIKNFVLLALFTTSNISIYAQTKEDIMLPEVFPTEDAVWVITVKGHWSGLDYNNDFKFNTTYYLLGDTIIGNKKYSKLYSIYGELDSLKVKSCDFYTENQLYVGAIRVEGEKVYLRPHEVIYHSDGEICPHIWGIDYDGYPYYHDEEIDYSFFEEDVLMYDFSIEESERLYILNIQSFCPHFLAYKMTKNIFTSKIPLIKGIGSTIGLWFDNFLIPERGLQIFRNLHSFYNKGKRFYPTEESGIEEVKGVETEAPKAKAFVSNGVLYIENVEGINTVEIYDIIGRVITSGTYDSKSVQIQLPSTLKGVILVKVNSEIVKIAI